jgi:hypothetical protein
MGAPKLDSCLSPGAVSVVSIPLAFRRAAARAPCMRQTCQRLPLIRVVYRRALLFEGLQLMERTGAHDLPASAAEKSNGTSAQLACP